MTVRATSVEQLVDRLVGTTLLGKYRVDALLGWGGAAAVFAATHRNGHRVAIKLLHPAIAADARSRTRFLREGYLANRVGHAGAVRVLDDDVLPDGSALLVMELLDGRGVDALAEGAAGKLPIRQVCDLTWQLLDVLAAAHDRGIVHRDIKPQNLYWTREGALKVLDFGLARIHAPEATQVITQTGDAFGTPAFMAPEQAMGDMDRVDAASDQWSAAATAFNLLTGAYVHDARNPTEMMVLCATRPARSVREVDPTVPESIAAAIDRALAFDKARRWPHVRDFQRALERACEAAFGEPLGPPVPTSKRAPRPVVRPRALRVGLAGVGLAGLAAIASFYAVRATVAPVAPALRSAPSLDAPSDPGPGSPLPRDEATPPAAVTASPEGRAAAFPGSALRARTASPPSPSSTARARPSRPGARRDPWSAQ